eukprot:1620687-Prorocentrum_lima.AAC.1
MHDAPHLTLWVVEAARAGLSADEADALKGLGVEGLPAGRGRPRAVEASDQLRTHPWLGHFRRESHVDVLADKCVEVRLADVDEKCFPGSRAAPAYASPPTRGQVR